MRVNLWYPGTALSKNSIFIHLMNAMCDVMQFFIYTITTETYVEHLATLFMKNFVLSFVMVAIIFIDADSRFKNLFKYMCADLGIIYCTLAHGNNKGTRVEKYHNFSTKHKQSQAKTEAHTTFFSRMQQPLSTPGIVP